VKINNMKKYRFITLVLVLSIFSFAGKLLAKEITIGVLALSGVEEANISWQPTIDYLNKHIEHYSFKLMAIEPGDMSDMNFKVKKNEIDFAIIPPSLYIDLENLYGASAILTLVDKSKQSQFGSTFIVRRDNRAILRIDDINNKSVAAVAKEALGGWLIGQQVFINNGIDLYEASKRVDFLGTQPKVVQSVLAGGHDFGIIRTGMLESLSEQGKINISDFRIINQHHIDNFPYLLSSDLYPEWVFAKTKNTSLGLAKAVAIALLSIPSGGEVARTAGYWEWTMPLNYQPVHELMKALRVGSYKDYGKITTSDYILQNKYTVISIIAFLSGLIVLSILLSKMNKKLTKERDEKNELMTRFKALARHDGLTGLLNRNSILELLQSDIDYASRANERLAIMFIDLDGFKQVNDSLGHEMGDKVLVETANVLQKTLRKSDFCGRYGGDEFVVAVKGFDNDDGVNILAQKLIDRISTLAPLEQKSVKINASIGIVIVSPTLETTPEYLLKIADNQMYQAKAQGKGRFVTKILSKTS